MSTKQFVWLITGTSSGLGHDLSITALNRGDKVVATARDPSKIQDLKDKGASTLELDVTAPLPKLHEIAKQAVGIHGRIDVVVNNAGYVEFGALEETTPEETYRQFNINVFGALNVCRAFLPYLRAQKSGTIVWVSSMAAWIELPFSGLYGATKFAVRGLSETLNAEISPLGLRSVSFEPGFFRSSLLEKTSRRPYNPRIQDYAETGRTRDGFLHGMHDNSPGDPKRVANVIVDVMRGEGAAEARRVIPGSLQLGSDTLHAVRNVLDRTDNALKEWEDVIASTDFPKDADLTTSSARRNV